jgi:predicted 2-oxoglutarate/Fe(II)-dependent dioxygenase YbiX
MEKISRSEPRKVEFIKPVVLIPNFLTDSELDLMEKILHEKSENDIKWIDDVHAEKGDYRISAINYELTEDGRAKKIITKVRKKILSVNKNNFKFPRPKFPDPLFVSHYFEGGFRTLHHDGGFVDEQFYGKDDEVQNKRFLNRRITCVIQLSDKNDYEGGELVIPFYEKFIDKEVFHKKGTMILFASHILHEVPPIKKGSRKSLITFMCGGR